MSSEQSHFHVIALSCIIVLVAFSLYLITAGKKLLNILEISKRLSFKLLRSSNMLCLNYPLIFVHGISKTYDFTYKYVHFREIIFPIAGFLLCTEISIFLITKHLLSLLVCTYFVAV